MRNLYVPLRRAELDELVEWALAEKRRPQDQAALILEEALKARAPEPLRPTDRQPEPLAAA